MLIFFGYAIFSSCLTVILYHTSMLIAGIHKPDMESKYKINHTKKDT